MGKSDTADLEISVKGSSEPTADLGRDGVAEIGVTLRHLLADVFALHMKTKNFHWHRSGVHFRDHYLLLDERLKDSDEESLGPKAMLTELVPTIGNCLGSYAWRTRCVKSTTMSPLPA